MALIVEDGTGKTDAEAYDTIANVTAYLALYNPSATWAGLSDADKESACRIATQYLDMVYGERYDGERYTATQALDWPRAFAEYKGHPVESDEIPVALRRAMAEAARQHAEGDTLIPSSRTSSATKSREYIKVGPIVLDDEYAGGKEDNAPPTFDRIEALLDPLVSGEGEIERG